MKETTANRKPQFATAKYDFVRGYLVYTLWLAKGKTADAARMAGWTVPNFCQILRRYKLKAADFRR